MARSPVSVYTLQLFSLVKTRFPWLPYSVNLSTKYKSLTHYTKVRSHPITSNPTASFWWFDSLRSSYHCLVRLLSSPSNRIRMASHLCTYKVQVLFLPSPGFTRFPSVPAHYRSIRSICSGGWSPLLRQDITCPPTSR